MNSQQQRIKISDLNVIKQQLLSFSECFDTCNIYDSNEKSAPLEYARFELLAAYGCDKVINGSFEEITSTIERDKNWVFGYMAYEAYCKFDSAEELLMNEACFYNPQIVCIIEKGSDVLIIENNGISDKKFIELVNLWQSMSPVEDENHMQNLQFKPCTDKTDYIENIEKIKDNILQGDYYEINYCQKFVQQGTLNNAISTFNAINRKSPTPFAAFVKNEAFNILCTSPERFIYRDSSIIISQPIKGTNQRMVGSENLLQLAALRDSEKETAENVMIVDLVRNDLARICKTGSIKVEELFGTYPFALVNQMISTISGELKQETTLAQIFHSLFPMGSMTGAPKIEVMKNIENYENTNRGLYSGTIGYIMPDGNFDFNVIIRTIVEDKQNENVSYHVGGAITYDSVPEKEYEECLLKAKGLVNLEPRS